MTTSCRLPDSIFPLLEELDGLTGHAVSTVFLSGSTHVWLRIQEETEQSLKAIVASLETEQWILPCVPIQNSQGLTSYIQVTSTKKLQNMSGDNQTQKASH